MKIESTDAGVLALLADTSRAGYSGYGGHDGYFGDLSSNAVRTDTVATEVERNGEDAHFFALSSEGRGQFDILNHQSQANELAGQAQISQLALQLCQCCNDQKSALGMIEGKLECLGKETALEILIAKTNQDCQDLLGQIATQQNVMNAAQSNDQHAQILGILGQIAGTLSSADDDDGKGGRRKCRKRRRCRKCRCCECECNGDGVTIRNIAISGNGNGPRGGGGGIVEDIEDIEDIDDNEEDIDDDGGGDDDLGGGDSGGRLPSRLSSQYRSLIQSQLSNRLSNRLPKLSTGLIRRLSMVEQRLLLYPACKITNQLKSKGVPQRYAFFHCMLYTISIYSILLY